ncbi:hypothetical protein BU15DRAFT_74073 [Melanogaster broomeanus]|nr:hypothetical protein BU15DRAFT_74073 [Melanogaster broomeanus]
MSDLVPATSAIKHKCLSSEACIIHLSDIGRHCHTFPKGTFSARFAPPALPLFVTRYCAVHPLYWQWTTKSGPNAGKTFKVPAIPTHCSKGSPKAISWLVNVFHSFKAHLAPSALCDGKVPKPLLQTYQSNMVLHLRAQLRAHSLSDTTPPSLQPVVPGVAPPTLNPEKAVLHSPVMSPPPPAHPFSNDASLIKSLKALYASAVSKTIALEAELAALCSTLEASSAHSIPPVTALLTSAAPSPNPFTIAAGLVPAAKQTTRAQPARRARVKGTVGPTGPTHPIT